jgi:hypothetical protein
MTHLSAAKRRWRDGMPLGYIPESQVKSRSYSKSSAQVCWAEWRFNQPFNCEVRLNFRECYLMPALAVGLIKRTIPEKPNSCLQKYRLIAKGRALLETLHQTS